MKHTISGVILAGGKSSRMGQDKAYLKIRGRRLIDIVLDTFKPFFDDIIIAADTKSRFEEFSHIKVCEDLMPERGPLGGIYAALKACRFEKALFAACDMPYLKADLISRLLDLAQDDSFDCFVPLTRQGPEPLLAVYSKKLLPKIEDALKGNDLSLRSFLKGCNCRYIQISDPERISFSNINTPKDFKDAG